MIKYFLDEFVGLSDVAGFLANTVFLKVVLEVFVMEELITVLATCYSVSGASLLILKHGRDSKLQKFANLTLRASWLHTVFLVDSTQLLHGLNKTNRLLEAHIAQAKTLNYLVLVEIVAIVDDHGWDVEKAQNQKEEKEVY